MAEISSLAVYLPLLRLDRAAAGAALRWSGLGGARAGHRAVAGWDEDALTLAVEAARTAVRGQDAPAEAIFASTSAQFHDRLQATLLVDALHLPSATMTQDVAGSRRAGVSALLRALRQDDSVLIAAGEKRPVKPGSSAEVSWGDGGAAVMVGAKGFAQLRGHASLSRDFVDFYASRAHPAPYVSEERFVRDTAIGDVLHPVISAALANAGVAAAAITRAVVPEPAPASYKALAAKLGLKAPNMLDAVQAGAGDLGAAHPLFGLALACEGAKAGDLILLVGFGSGADALVLEITRDPPPNGAAAALAEGEASKDYVRFLSLSGNLDLDWGARSELDQKITAPVLERYGSDMLGFIGGRDSTGNVQFPKTLRPVSPDADVTVPLTDVRLADEPARIQSLTADRLNYTPDPPFYFGLVQFANGARVLMEFCDVPPKSLSVGSAVAMRFRVKSIDRKRGFRSYFWKACPLHRPAMEI